LIMTDKLPPNLLALFAPRPPLPYSKPLDRDPAKRKGPTITGVGQLVNLLKDYDPDYVPTETVEEKKKRKAIEKKQKSEEAIKKGLEEWDPNKDENVTGDPFKTLFVARMSYEMTEKDLRREFEMYGPIENIRIVKNKVNGKPRGYAFIEFEREKDMKAAYKDADGVKLLGRRILVDVERGRTVKGWRPRRLGKYFYIYYIFIANVILCD
ncbi:U1 small nuclear ribonucleo protein of 70kDa MW N terminal-domain-containing protein, partial [Gigaspora rosea]